jgi:hypothetical protein
MPNNVRGNTLPFLVSTHEFRYVQSIASYLDGKYITFLILCLKILAYQEETHIWSLIDVSTVNVVLPSVVFDGTGISAGIAVREPVRRQYIMSPNRFSKLSRS